MQNRLSRQVADRTARNHLPFRILWIDRLVPPSPAGPGNRTGAPVPAPGRRHPCISPSAPQSRLWYARSRKGGRTPPGSGRSRQDHPQEAFPPRQSGPVLAFLIGVFHALLSRFQSGFLLFFRQIELHRRAGARGSRKFGARCAAAVPQGKPAPWQDCSLLFISFICWFMALKRPLPCTGQDIRSLPETSAAAAGRSRHRHL